MDVASLIHSEPLPPTLKRRASSTFDIDDEPSSSSSSRKRLREEGGGESRDGRGTGAAPPAVDGAALADELEQELHLLLGGDLRALATIAMDLCTFSR